jgi:DNA adenine methylase
VDRQTLKPPFAYFGGKTTLAPQIAALLPKHEHYVEPFAGSLAVLLAKKPSRAETVNDLDGDLVTFWRVLRDRPDELERRAMLTPHARAEQEAARTELASVSDELERARLTWVRLTQGRAHSMKDHTGWWRRAKVKGGRPIAQDLETFASRIPSAAQRLKRVSIECRDALDVVRDYGSEPSVCIYADPPYLGTTRATNYRVEMLDDDAHRTFADALNECKASVVLSGYDSPLYAELFDGWHRKDLAAPTTLSGDTDRTEVLWSNRPIGTPDLFSFDAEASA